MFNINSLFKVSGGPDTRDSPLVTLLQLQFIRKFVDITPPSLGMKHTVDGFVSGLCIILVLILGFLVQTPVALYHETKTDGYANNGKGDETDIPC